MTLSIPILKSLEVLQPPQVQAPLCAQATEPLEAEDEVAHLVHLTLKAVNIPLSPVGTTFIALYSSLDRMF